MSFNSIFAPVVTNVPRMNVPVIWTASTGQRCVLQLPATNETMMKEISPVPQLSQLTPMPYQIMSLHEAVQRKESENCQNVSSMSAIEKACTMDDFLSYLSSTSRSINVPKTVPHPALKTVNVPQKKESKYTHDQLSHLLFEMQKQKQLTEEDIVQLMSQANKREGQNVPQHSNRFRNMLVQKQKQLTEEDIVHLMTHVRKQEEQGVNDESIVQLLSQTMALPSQQDISEEILDKMALSPVNSCADKSTEKNGSFPDAVLSQQNTMRRQCGSVEAEEALRILRKKRRGRPKKFRKTFAEEFTDTSPVNAQEEQAYYIFNKGEKIKLNEDEYDVVKQSLYQMRQGVCDQVNRPSERAPVENGKHNDDMSLREERSMEKGLSKDEEITIFIRNKITGNTFSVGVQNALGENVILDLVTTCHQELSIQDSSAAESVEPNDVNSLGHRTIGRGRPRKEKRKPVLVIPKNASTDEIRKLKNKHYQRTYRFRQLTSANAEQFYAKENKRQKLRKKILQTEENE